MGDHLHMTTTTWSRFLKSSNLISICCADIMQPFYYLPCFGANPHNSDVMCGWRRKSPLISSISVPKHYIGRDVGKETSPKPYDSTLTSHEPNPKRIIISSPRVFCRVLPTKTNQQNKCEFARPVKQGWRYWR